MDLATLGLFAIAALVLTATPGPDMLLIVSRAAAQGRSAGFATLAGIQFGTYIHAIAAAAGLSQAFLLVPVAYEIVRWLGAAYLLYLAIRTVWGAADRIAAAPARPLSLPRMFTEGLLTNLLNPKMVLFMLALLPQFIDPTQPALFQAVILATILNVCGLLTNGVAILAADRLGRSFGSGGRVAVAMRWLLGAVFAGLALRLATSSRP